MSKQPEVIETATGRVIKAGDICVRGEPGYYPVPSWICCGATLNAAQNYADELNRDRDFTLDQAAAVVSSSMRAGRIRA